MKLVFANVFLISFFCIVYIMINKDTHDFEKSITDDVSIYEINELDVSITDNERKTLELKDCFLMGNVSGDVNAELKMNFKYIECSENLVNDAFAFEAPLRHKGCM